MRRAYRLRSNDDFRRVRREGASWAHPLLVLFAARNDRVSTRLGVSVSKRVGGAVVRNRVKRRIRESFRQRWLSVPSGWDLVVIVRAPAADRSFAEIDEAVGQLLQRAGLRADSPWDASPRG